MIRARYYAGRTPGQKSQKMIELAACPQVGDWVLLRGEDGGESAVRAVTHNPRVDGSTFDVHLDFER